MLSFAAPVVWKGNLQAIASQPFDPVFHWQTAECYPPLKSTRERGILQVLSCKIPKVRIGKSASWNRFIKGTQFGFPTAFVSKIRQ